MIEAAHLAQAIQREISMAAMTRISLTTKLLPET